MINRLASQGGQHREIGYYQSGDQQSMLISLELKTDHGDKSSGLDSEQLETVEDMVYCWSIGAVLFTQRVSLIILLIVSGGCLHQVVGRTTVGLLKSLQ